jgi:hypothetical protein
LAAIGTRIAVHICGWCYSKRVFQEAFRDEFDS